MKKHEIYCDYDKRDEKYVAVSREFFGLVIYADTEQELMKSIVTTLRVYAGDSTISGKNVEIFATNAYRKQLSIEREVALNEEQQTLTM